MSKELDRLLRAAASASDESWPIEAPFGFDTRVVANWRALGSRNGSGTREFARLLRRIALTAVVIASCASAGAFWQLQENVDLADATNSGYTLADTVIEANTLQ